MRCLTRAAAAALAAAALAAAPASADEVVADDLIVQGSNCTGLDCLDGEAFGSDTLRLKENNTRLAFSDTSAGAQPGNDWEITANDSGSGGASHLQVLDTTSERAALRVLAGAPTGALTLTRAGAPRAGAGAGVFIHPDASTELQAAVDADAVLAALAKVPISRYRLTAEPAGAFHVGPVGGTFNTAFGLGTGSVIATGDVAGTALAALQALAPRVAAATPGGTGPAGPAGAAGAKGPPGDPGAPGSPGPAQDAYGAAAGAAITALERRLARLDARQARLSRRTTALAKRVGRVGEEVAEG